MRLLWNTKKSWNPPITIKMLRNQPGETNPCIAYPILSNGCFFTPHSIPSQSLHFLILSRSFNPSLQYTTTLHETAKQEATTSPHKKENRTKMRSNQQLTNEFERHRTKIIRKMKISQTQESKSENYNEISISMQVPNPTKNFQFPTTSSSAHPFNPFILIFIPPS